MSKNDVNNLRVVVGDQDIKNSFDTQSAKTYTVKRVVRHKNFDINTLFHDVAVLSLSQGSNSIEEEKNSSRFSLKKWLEFWLVIPYTEKNK